MWEKLWRRFTFIYPLFFYVDYDIEAILDINLLLCKYFRFTYSDIDNFDWIVYKFYINKLEEYLKNKKDNLEEVIDV